jgi:sensor histidine kinase YesM
VREHENALKAEQRIKIMMSQIQPHFLYNTLTTIQSLCLTNPQKAFETTGKFGSYLRNNIDSLNRSELITVEKELEHTRVYADIEMLRFPKISVEYHIEAADFCVPALTIQPLVENAIRHGVRDVDRGLVEVSTKQTEGGNIIIISDNGVGFDTNIPFSTDKDHIGIKNVSERIKSMCGGTLSIDSKLGEGTVITITIPRE